MRARLRPGCSGFCLILLFLYLFMPWCSDYDHFRSILISSCVLFVIIIIWRVDQYLERWWVWDFYGDFLGGVLAGSGKRRWVVGWAGWVAGGGVWRGVNFNFITLNSSLFGRAIRY